MSGEDYRTPEGMTAGRRQHDVCVPLSVIVLTFNEEANIGRCLGALAWASDVVLVDSGSTDRTVTEAQRALPSVRIFEHPFGDFGQQRNWALDSTSLRHEWVLFVDADELCTSDFVEEVRTFLANPGANVGAYIAGKNRVMGRWARYSTFYPSYQLRLLKRGKVWFMREGHGQRGEADGPCVYLREGWWHEWMSKGLDEWRRRHERYAEQEVELLCRLACEPLRLADVANSDPMCRRQALKRLSARCGGFFPLAHWFYRFVVRGGWRDGKVGWLVCALQYEHALRIERLRKSPRWR